MVHRRAAENAEQTQSFHEEKNSALPRRSQRLCGLPGLKSAILVDLLRISVFKNFLLKYVLNSL